MQLRCFNAMINFSLFCGGGSGRGGIYSGACFVIEGGVYFVCEMHWAGGDGVFSVVQRNVREEKW